MSIIKTKNPLLSKKVENINILYKNIIYVLDKMLIIMSMLKGIGIAGPQIGNSLSVFLVDLTIDPNKYKESKISIYKKKYLVLINPELWVNTDKTSKFVEGCLSFPEIYCEIERPIEIIIRYKNLKNSLKELTCNGLLSRLIQHEYDHILGIVYLKRINLKLY